MPARPNPDAEVSDNSVAEEGASSGGGDLQAVLGAIAEFTEAVSLIQEAANAIQSKSEEAIQDITQTAARLMVEVRSDIQKLKQQAIGEIEQAKQTALGEIRSAGRSGRASADSPNITRPFDFSF